MSIKVKTLKPVEEHFLVRRIIKKWYNNNDLIEEIKWKKF
jgi:hypothetical protein